MFGLKKIVKPNLAEKASFKNLPDLTGAVYFYGKLGSGKTTSLLSFAQKYHDDERKRYKIFDLWGGERNEHLYWCFPSQDAKYWNSVRKLLSLNKAGPKQYQVHLLYPYWKDLTPSKLPFDPPNIKSSIFTIPIESLVLEDIYLSLGLISESDKFLWNESTRKLKKQEGPRMLSYYATKIAKKNQILYKNFILPMTRNLLLQEKGASTNLDIIEEMKDRETISILCLEFLPKEFRLFVMGWILRQINNALDDGKIRLKNLLLIREAAEFFRATDESLMPPMYKMFRSQLSNFLRMGRRGIHFFLDAQSPRETRGLVSGQQDLTILCRLPAENDREDATAQLYRDNLITKRKIQQLAVLEPGQVMFVESGKRVQFRYILLPRTMYWKPGHGDFYEHVYKRLNGNFKNFEPTIEEIQAKWQEENKRLDEMRLIAEMKKKQEEEEKKTENVEMEKMKIEIEREKQQTLKMKQEYMERKEALKVEKVGKKKQAKKTPPHPSRPASRFSGVVSQEEIDELLREDEAEKVNKEQSPPLVNG